MNIFISYSHRDEEKIKKFISHFDPVVKNNAVSLWYDRYINGGDSLQKKIDENFYISDIIIMFITSNFLSSSACMKEKEEALKLRNDRGITVVPVILSTCDWTSYKELAELLAIPTDGKPISKFEDEDEGYGNVVDYLKKNIGEIKKIQNIKIKPKYEEFLKGSELLAKSHKNKDVLNLEDIFINRSIKCYDEEEISHNSDVESLLSNLLKYPKTIIAGENQAGKTTVCKKIIEKYLSIGLFPVYIDFTENIGKISNKIKKELEEQYDNLPTDIEISHRVVPVLDNFHLLKSKEKTLSLLENYGKIVLIVDEIFGLDLSNQDLIKDFHKFKFKELNSKERSDLIKKWILIGRKNPVNDLDFFKELDEKTEAIDTSLGLIFGKGVMPCYPFFILSLLSTYDTQNPLDSSITSQGHCYQALIYMYLRKQGVKNEHIDIYLNFLTELSFYLYENSNKSVGVEEIGKFTHEYRNRFNMPIDLKEFLNNLSEVNICKYDSFNNFHFCYLYIYYYFVGKYIAENINEKLVSQKLVTIISNLHKDENAYITIFITHHTKSNILLDEILINSNILFESNTPSTLDTKELSFFDSKIDNIVQAILPEYSNNPNSEREKELEIKEKRNEVFESQESSETLEEIDEQAEELAINLRLSIKTVEVMGLIIKNRSGSLDKVKLAEIFKEGLNLNLRILSSFISLVSSKDTEEAMVSILKERIDKIVEEKENDNKPKLTSREIEKLVREIYWNLNFGILHGIITKTIHSLGSSNLINIADDVSNEIQTPATFIVNQGIKMWYGKNLRVDEISKRIDQADFSKTAERLVKVKVAEHCRLHKIAYADMQKLESKLNMSSKSLIVERLKIEKK